MPHLDFKQLSQNMYTYKLNTVSQLLRPTPAAPSTPVDPLPQSAARPALPPLPTALSQVAFVEPLPQEVLAQPGVKADTLDAVKAIPGRHWLGKLPSNGQREVAIMVPQGTDLSKPVELVYYFHGHHGTIAKGLADPAKGFAAELQSGGNRVFVIPQGPPKERDYTWMNPKNNENMADFQAASEKLLRETLAPGLQIDKVTLKGHSAGGRALMNGANSGMKADRMDFLDASYGSWATSAYQAQRKTNPQLDMRVVYIPGTQTAADALKLKHKPGITLHTSAVGHGSVPKHFLNLP